MNPGGHGRLVVIQVPTQSPPPGTSRARKSIFAHARASARHQDPRRPRPGTRSSCPARGGATPVPCDPGGVGIGRDVRRGGTIVHRDRRMGRRRAHHGTGSARCARESPSESTIRRTLGRVDAGVLDHVLGAWMWLRTSVVDGRRVIAVDGKTLRGARGAAGHLTHLLAALDHRTGGRGWATRGRGEVQRDSRTDGSARPRSTSPTSLSPPMPCTANVAPPSTSSAAAGTTCSP